MPTFKTVSVAVTSVLLSSSEVQGLHATPVTLLLAPGAGLAYVVLGVNWIYNYNTTDFNNGGSLAVSTKTDVNTSMEWAQVSTGLFKFKAASTMAMNSDNAPGQVTAALSDFENQPVILGATNAATVGDGSFLVTLIYSVIETQ